MDSIFKRIILAADSKLELGSFGYQQVSHDWTMDQRVLDEHLVYFLTAGCMAGSFESRQAALDCGCLLWLSPGIEHTFWIPRKATPMTLYRLRFKIFHAGRSAPLDKTLFCEPERMELLPFFEQLYDMLLCIHPWKEDRVKSILFLIYSTLVVEVESSRAARRVLSYAQRQRLLEYYHRSVAAWPTATDLANTLGLSLDYFSRLFKQTYGIAPKTWIARERIRMASMYVIESNLQISEIAYRFGYEDVFLFSRQFKKFRGKSPSEFRASR